MPYRILMTGGGTAGSIIPLLVVAKECKKVDPSIEVAFVVTKNPAELQLVQREGYTCRTFSAGKLRRYRHWRNVLDIFIVAWAFLKAIVWLTQQRPSVVVSAGSFLSVPIVWAAWVRRIPVLIHQQDVTVGLANRLMAPFAHTMTVAIQESAEKIHITKRIQYTGNPVREEFFHSSRLHALQRFHLTPEKPVLCVLGGSSGAQFLNQLIFRVADRFHNECQILHITGLKLDQKKLDSRSYHQVAFLHEGTVDALAAADIVVTRAGLSTLSEIAAVGRAAVVIPMPATHQEANAKYFEQHYSTCTLAQQSLTDEKFLGVIQSLLREKEERLRMARTILHFAKPDAAKMIAHEIFAIVKTT